MCAKQQQRQGEGRRDEGEGDGGAHGRALSVTGRMIISGLDSLSHFGEWDSQHHMWRRELPVSLPCSDGSSPSPPIVVFEDPNSASIGGEFFLWPASLVLSDFMLRNPSLVRGKTVLELGSGHGLAAMTAHAVGARRVLATDQASVIPYLSMNIGANPARRVDVSTLEWGADLGASVASPALGVDMVIGSDLTFNRDAFLPLLFTLQQLVRTDEGLDSSSERRRDKRVLLLHDDESVPGGCRFRVDFFEKAALRVLHVAKADLAACEDDVREGGRCFHTNTVHAYWLSAREGAEEVTRQECDASLAKLSQARRHHQHHQQQQQQQQRGQGQAVWQAPKPGACAGVRMTVAEMATAMQELVKTTEGKSRGGESAKPPASTILASPPPPPPPPTSPPPPPQQQQDAVAHTPPHAVQVAPRDEGRVRMEAGSEEGEEEEEEEEEGRYAATAMRWLLLSPLCLALPLHSSSPLLFSSSPPLLLLPVALTVCCVRSAPACASTDACVEQCSALARGRERRPPLSLSHTHTHTHTLRAHHAALARRRRCEVWGYGRA